MSPRCWECVHADDRLALVSLNVQHVSGGTKHVRVAVGLCGKHRTPEIQGRLATRLEHLADAASDAAYGIGFRRMWWGVAGAAIGAGRAKR